MNIAYFDCFSGVSGDMILGALLDLGLPEDDLRRELTKLPVEGWRLHAGKERRGSIGGTRVQFEIGRQPHRHYGDVVRIIRESELDDAIKERALAVFEKLGRAEARVHQTPLDHVHFHEVGALDSILDIVGGAAAMHLLGLEEIHASPIPLGRGFVKTHHGMLPIPAPATAVLLEGLPVYDNGVERELTTPTGAAMLATLATAFGSMPAMSLQATGYGVGSHLASDPPNLLRVMMGSVRLALRATRPILIETNIDNMNPELYDYLFERLFAAGVLDVNLVPMQMKKNRPGVLLRVLAEPGLRAEVLDIVFRETTTLGIRIQEVERVELPREAGEVRTPYGAIKVKWAEPPEGGRVAAPEYEDCKRAAREHGAPLRRVYEEALLAARREG